MGKRYQGRAAGFEMGAEHRLKIKNSQILNQLIKYALNDPTCKIKDPQRAQVGLSLLRKVMPDLAHNTHANDPDNPLIRSAYEHTDAELAAIAAMGSATASQKAPGKNKLN